MSFVEILAPTHCPCCESVLENSNGILYCRNPKCEATQSKKIEHFTKTLKIKGFGPSTIARLGLESIAEVYEVTEELLATRLNSEKIAAKLYDEVQRSTKATLNELLPAFGIPLVGKTATQKLASVCSSVYDITEETCKKAGLGPKATESLLSWLEGVFPEYEHLPFSFNFETTKPNTGAQGIVCISGKLSSFKTKQEAAVILESKGFKVKPSLTKEVTILVNESLVESSKTKKARESGITIVTNLTEFLENY